MRPQVVHALRWSVLGVLLVVSGLFPLLIGPGDAPIASWILFPSGIVATFGVGITIIAIAIPLVATPSKPPPVRSFRRTREVLPIALGGVVFVTMFSLSAGWIQGLYLPPAGGSTYAVTGCGGLPPGIGAPSSIDSFPPWVTISLKWNVSGPAGVRVYLSQDGLNSGQVVWSTTVTGESGALEFRSSAGAFTIVATNASACPARESLEVNWNY